MPILILVISFLWVFLTCSLPPSLPLTPFLQTSAKMHLKLLLE